MSIKILALFPAFKYRDFRLYILTQLITVGSKWMQQIAQAWLVFEITQSPFMVGLVAGVRNLPIFLMFGLLGGALVDRFKNKKNVLYVTKYLELIFSIILAFLTIAQIITISQLVVIVFLIGIVEAVDNPARQVFVASIVDKKELSSAVAITAGAVNIGRFLGPSIAGFLIFFIQPGGVFLVNAFFYFVTILIFLFIKEKIVELEWQKNPLKSIKQGIIFSFTHKTIRPLLIFGAITSIFGWSFTTILPVVARDSFNFGAVELGYMFAAFGIGSVAATLLVSIFADRVNKISYIIFGSLMFSLSMIVFSFGFNIHVSLVLLFMGGFGLISQYAMMNTAIQDIVPNYIRGRVMSIYALMIIGMLSLGSFQIGLVAESFGSLLSIGVGSFVVFLAAIYIILIRKSIMAPLVSQKS